MIFYSPLQYTAGYQINLQRILFRTYWHLGQSKKSIKEQVTKNSQMKSTKAKKQANRKRENVEKTKSIQWLGVTQKQKLIT